MGKKLSSITDVRPQVRNANRHSQRGMGVLEKSIQSDGWIGAITVAADGETFDGSARVETGAAGFADVEPIVVRSDGSRPVIHIREDIPNADDPRAIRLGVAANRVAALNYDPDPALLAALAGEVDLSGLYYDDELAAIIAQAGTDILDAAGVDVVPEQWMVLIECKNEQEQAVLLERLTDEGLSCRALTS